MNENDEIERPAAANEWMTLSQVCEFMGVSRSTVDRMIRRGELVAFRLGSAGHKRCRRSDVDAAMPQVEPTERVA